MSQAQVRESGSIKVAAMGLNSMKEQAAGLAKLMRSVQWIVDPNMGQNVNVLA